MSPKYPDDPARLERAIAESRRVIADAERFLADYVRPPNQHMLELVRLLDLRRPEPQAPR